MDREGLKEQLASYVPKPLGQQRVYAVLIPLVQVAGEWSILYQIRGQKVSQAGEVSFPGGRVEKGEAPRQAAIRETVEELCVSADQIDIWGELDFVVYQAQTVHCFVGQLLVEDWTSLAPNEEVERLFVLPLKTLQENRPVYYTLTSQLDSESDFPFERIQGGRGYSFSHLTRKVPFYEGLTENIWGLTAHLTERLVEFQLGE